MKTEVYSWRVSAARKADLESEARREGTSVAELLEKITSDWLQERRNSRNGRKPNKPPSVAAPLPPSVLSGAVTPCDLQRHRS